ncbi:ATP-binding protein [Microlunatus sp. GCM10028923]|uniref:ATP-binding protein n=1 Tax=Microlunatus sp. GCM10028923 TaxID=3273400 RepID=UPI003607FA4A
MTVSPDGHRFFGRREVLSVLRRHLQDVAVSRSGRLVALRGRRQVGKSTVVERFVQAAKTPYVFVTGVFQASMIKQLDDATIAINESTRRLPDAELLTQSVAGSWREWFGRLAIAAREGPVIAVLDEFPWLTDADPALEGELQAQWDRTLAKLPVLMIIIGSDVAMMDRLASHGRPLFGRLSPVVVPALNPAEIAEAVPRRSALEVFDAYLVTGGYPRLVTDLSRHPGSVADFVRDSLSDAYSALVTTARLSLDSEFPEPQFAYRVLSAIGASDSANPGFKDVLGTISDADERKRAETSTTRALRTLTEVKGLIERELPAWAPASSKIRRYRVTDPYLRFWFRYVERNVDRISRGRADLAVDAFARDWEGWRGQSIEPVVRDAMLRLARTDDNLDGVDSVLPWWVRDNSVEVDVVAATAKRTALVGTIKWRARGGVTASELEQLRQHRDRVPHSDTALLGAISPSGRSPKGADVAYSAADLLAAWE